MLNRMDFSSPVIPGLTRNRVGHRWIAAYAGMTWLFFVYRCDSWRLRRHLRSFLFADHMRRLKRFFSVAFALCLAGCSLLQDSATSVAADIENGVGRLGRAEGATHVIVHEAKARAGANVRSITVQFDKVGALIVWYYDAEGKVLESGSTSYHSRFVDTAETIIVDKPVSSALRIELQRRNGRAVVTRVF